MSNFAVIFDNQADTSILTLGSWAAAYPQSNLKDYRLGKKARTTDAASANTKLRFALASPCYVGAVALLATNLSVDATYQLLLYSDSGFTTQVYDSGVVTLYPAGTIPYGAIPWGAPNWWTAKPLPAEITRFQRNLAHVLSNAMYAQYGELRIFDTANSAGYIEAGRLMVGQSFIPARNVTRDSVALQLTSRTTRVDARDGTPYFDTLKPSFSMPFAFNWLTEDEGLRALDLQVIADTHGEVIVIWDHEEEAYAFRRQVFGRLARLDPVRHPHVATYAVAFQVEGVLYG
jgi:hypothetical protein